MYIPASNAEHRPEVMFDFIEAHPFGALVTASPEGLYATHLPLVLDRSRGARGALVGHVARANAHHAISAAAGEALVIFTGPDAYVSPSFYATKAVHGKVVPTWNYVAVHVYGAVRFTEDPAFLRAHLEQLTARHERDRAQPWSLADAPAEYIEQMMRAIVGVEIEISRIEGKWKMSQNRSSEDIDGVVAGLRASSDAREREVATIVDARRPALTDKSDT
jgi:transcriptional regulator